MRRIMGLLLHLSLSGLDMKLLCLKLYMAVEGDAVRGSSRRVR